MKKCNSRCFASQARVHEAFMNKYNSMSVSLTMTAPKEQHVGKHQQNMKGLEKLLVPEKKLRNKL
eukprot:8707725-Lingulodinium_polyedra.AAC.1